MNKQDVVALLQSVSMDELRKAIPVRERMEKLEKKRRDLEKEMASVDRQIESLLRKSGVRPRPRAGTKKSVRKGIRRRVAQPSLSSLVVEILGESKKPLKINDICDALLTEKGYKTRAKDFKAQIRVMMYRNEKGLFKKTGPGLFRLAAGTQPKVKGVTKVKTKAKTRASTKAKRKAKAKTRASTKARRKAKAKTRASTKARRKAKAKTATRKKTRK